MPEGKHAEHPCMLGHTPDLSALPPSRQGSVMLSNRLGCMIIAKRPSLTFGPLLGVVARLGTFVVLLLSLLTPLFLTPAVAGAAGETVVFGDSLAVAISPYVEGLVGGAVLVDAVVGRTTLEGVSIAAARQPEFSQAGSVILSLGANDGQNTARYARMLGQILDSMGPGPRVVLVGLADTKTFHTGVNNVMANEAANRSNVAYANWAAIADGSTGLLRGDGVHLTARGASTLASLAVDTLNGVAQPPPVVTETTANQALDEEQNGAVSTTSVTDVASPASTTAESTTTVVDASERSTATVPTTLPDAGPGVATQPTSRSSHQEAQLATGTGATGSGGGNRLAGSNERGNDSGRNLPLLLRAVIVGGFLTVGIGYLRNNPSRVRVRRRKRVVQSQERHPAQSTRPRQRGALAPPLIRIDRRADQHRTVDRHPAGRRHNTASTWSAASKPRGSRDA
ncbi:MAG: hypothetical protein KDB86_04540 [Actinobacteria bacterium]|nr:hypothetical protein [Actinomycetota bacterium]